MAAIVVAGGATGIGAAVVRSLRARGDDVVLADLNHSAGESLIAEDARGRGYFVQADLSLTGTPAEVIESAVALLGGRLDALFYNAGHLIARPLERWSLEDWETSHAINLRSPFLMAQAASHFLRESSRGRIIVTSSTGAFRGHAGMHGYHSTKAGVLGLVRSLADELGPAGITVNALCPGWVDTPFNDEYWNFQPDPSGSLRELESSIPLRRQGNPDEIAKSALFLMDEASGYITGQALVVDGGYTSV